MQKRILFVAAGAFLLIAGYLAGTHNVILARTGHAEHASVPKSFGKLSAVIADSIGTGLVFEDTDGIIRFVSVTGMKEGQLARYDNTPVQGGIPKSYGHLAGAVVNHGQTGLVFEDRAGTIRFVTVTGTTENELRRE